MNDSEWKDIVETIPKMIKNNKSESGCYVLSGKTLKSLSRDDRFDFLDNNKLYRMENGIIDEA